MLRESLYSALSTTGMCLFILVGASLLSSFLGVKGVPAAFSMIVLNLGLHPIAILLLIYLLYVFLGCFIDGLSAMILTMSSVVPVITGLGFDPIWFGVILTVLIEVGLLTPPMGINLFVIHGISGCDLMEVVRGSVPFFLLMLVGIALFTALPSTILFLPNLFFGS